MTTQPNEVSLEQRKKRLRNQIGEKWFRNYANWEHLEVVNAIKSALGEYETALQALEPKQVEPLGMTAKIGLGGDNETWFVYIEDGLNTNFNSKQEAIDFCHAKGLKIKGEGV